MVALVAFVTASRLANMPAGIVLLVFVAGLAATSCSGMRHVQIAAGLALVAFVFQKFRGPKLRLN